MKNNRLSILFRKIAGAICMLALFSCFMGTVVCAAENAAVTARDAAVVSSRTTDDAVYIYIKGVSDITSGTTVQIGNTLCEDIQVAEVASMGMPVRTTILFDNSLSLSKRWGSQAKELVAGLIDNHAEGEEFKIATFADGLNVVSDFSAEYDSLKAAVEEIEFLDQASYLTDILYDLLKQSSDSHEANYTRFIIITDGADDNDIKYTQAELSDLMKSSGVVIHTVGVKTSKNNALLENLFSYARLTGGTYHIAESGTDVGAVRELIDGDHSLFCLRLVPAADIMDGGRKEAKLSLNTSNGPIVLTTSVQMPFADVSSMPPAGAEPGETPAPAPAATEKPELPSIAVEPQAGEEASAAEKTSIMPAIGIAAVILIIIIVLVALFVLKGKKNRRVDAVITNKEQSGDRAQKDGTQRDGAQASPAQQGAPPQSGGNTARLGGQMNADTAGKTMRLQGGSGQNGVRQSFVTLTDINNPQRSFRAPIDTRIVIGRESGDILLGHDAAASHTHCEIIKKGTLFYVNDLKSSNGTFYGGMRVYTETPVMNGGILEVGTCKYKLTIEN